MVRSGSEGITDRAVGARRAEPGRSQLLSRALRVKRRLLDKSRGEETTGVKAWMWVLECGELFCVAGALTMRRVWPAVGLRPRHLPVLTQFMPRDLHFTLNVFSLLPHTLSPFWASSFSSIK